MARNKLHYDFRQSHIWIEQALSQSCFQKQEQTNCHLVFIHGCGAGSSKPLIYGDAGVSDEIAQEAAGADGSDNKNMVS